MDSHTSLDRPKVAPLEGGLPIGSIPYGPRSSWPLIVNALWEKRGTWHVVQRQFKHPSSALGSARKWCDLLLPTEASEHLELAYRPIVAGKVEVYLRIRADGQEPLFSYDDDEEEEEEVAAVPIPPEEPQEAPEPAQSAPKPTRGRGGAPLFHEQDVRDIRELHRSGIGLQELAKEYGVSTTTIRKIVRRTSYSYVKDSPQTSGANG